MRREGQKEDKRQKSQDKSESGGQKGKPPLGGWGLDNEGAGLRVAKQGEKSIINKIQI